MLVARNPTCSMKTSSSSISVIFTVSMPSLFLNVRTTLKRDIGSEAFSESVVHTLGTVAECAGVDVKGLGELWKYDLNLSSVVSDQS